MFPTRIARAALFSVCSKSIEFGWCPPWRHPEYWCQSALLISRQPIAIDGMCGQHFHVLFMKNWRAFWSVNYNNVYGRSITTNISGIEKATANSPTFDLRSGWKSSPREICQRNSGRARTVDWNPMWTAAKKATTRKSGAVRTSLNPTKATPSPGDRGTVEQETWKSVTKPSAGDRGTEEQEAGVSEAVSR